MSGSYTMNLVEVLRGVGCTIVEVRSTPKPHTECGAHCREKFDRWHKAKEAITSYLGGHGFQHEEWDREQSSWNHPHSHISLNYRHGTDDMHWDSVGSEWDKRGHLLHHVQKVAKILVQHGFKRHSAYSAIAPSDARLRKQQKADVRWGQDRVYAPGEDPEDTQYRSWHGNYAGRMAKRYGIDFQRDYHESFCQALREAGCILLQEIESDVHPDRTNERLTRFQNARDEIDKHLSKQGFTVGAHGYNHAHWSHPDHGGILVSYSTRHDDLHWDSVHAPYMNRGHILKHVKAVAKIFVKHGLKRHSAVSAIDYSDARARKAGVRDDDYSAPDVPTTADRDWHKHYGARMAKRYGIDFKADYHDTEELIARVLNGASLDEALSSLLEHWRPYQHKHKKRSPHIGTHHRGRWLRRHLGRESQYHLRNWSR